MVREELIRRLADLAPPTPAACFALLWTYFEHDEVGLSSVEDLVQIRYDQVSLLPAYDFRIGSIPELSAAFEKLRAAEEREFDLLALRLLKGIDILLKQGEFQDFENARLIGLDGRPYTLRSRNHFLPALGHDQEDEILQESSKIGVTWAAHQGLSLAAYCRHYALIPCGRVKGIQILCRSASTWGNSYLQDRLLSERKSLRIMLWPFRCALDYPALRKMHQASPPVSVSLNSLENELELRDEVRAALDKASLEKATLLIFPELSIPPDTELEIRRLLASSGVDGYPILTLFGCSHRRNSAGNLDLNEAILLGPDGSELHRHRKLAPFVDYTFGERHPCGEKLEKGRTVTILESDLGNITPLICLDLLNETITAVLRRSHGNLFLVPSLSRTTKAHEGSALKLQVSNLGSTFVCNRWTSEPLPENTSFYRVPRKGGKARHLPEHSELPYLLFDLQE